MTENSTPSPPSLSVGLQLAALRQKRGLAVQDVSARLRFSTRQLMALEAGEYDVLPDMTFVRAMIRTYGRFLETDPAPLILALEAERPDAVPRLMVVQPVAVPSQGIAFFREVHAGNRRWISAALLLLVMALIGAWVWHLEDSPTDTVVLQNSESAPDASRGAAANRPPEP